MPGVLDIVIVYNKSNTFGLAKDAELLAASLPVVARKVGLRVAPVKLMDPHEPPRVCDICIHLETPYAVWFPWARINCMFINHEWWNAEEYGPYMSSFDAVLFRDTFARDKIMPTPESYPRLGAFVLPWCVASVFDAKVAERTKESNDCVWFLGGSVNKREAAKEILPLWKDTYPRLYVYLTEALSFDQVQLASNIEFHTGFLKPDQKQVLTHTYKGHVCFSKAESLGYTALEAESVGAWMFLNTIPCYESYYASSLDHISYISTPYDANGVAAFSDTSTISAQLDKAMETYLANIARSESLRTASLQRKETMKHALGDWLALVAKGIESADQIPKHMPPVLNPQDCPPISVITLVHNRPKFIENACLNLLTTDYPHDKIEWIVVDDSDPDQSPSDKVIGFQSKFGGVVKYLPLPKKSSIGGKRNYGIERASHNILLMMDDDDHYPITSFRRRVAYLLKGRRTYDCAACTTIAMYDLRNGVSAVNVPPFTLGLSKRCSEATLTFTRKFWEQRKFESVSIAEAESFLKGRESSVAEMPPQQIIVALQHGMNCSSRSVPPGKPSCFWGFSRPLLEFLHGLIGIKVEATNK